MNSNKAKLSKAILASGLVLALDCKNESNDGNGDTGGGGGGKHTLPIDKPTNNVEQKNLTIYIHHIDYPIEDALRKQNIGKKHENRKMKIKMKIKMNSNKAKLSKVILASGLILALGCKNESNEGNDGNGRQWRHGGGGGGVQPTVIKHTLSITKPTGGTITSNPGDINCGTGGSDCKASFNKGTKVTLTAQADAEYSPGDWQGACDEAKADQPCKLVIDADKTAGKAFFPTFILSSSAFMEGGLLPIASGRSDGFEGTSCTHATGDPQNHSPQLSWKNAPSQTRSFVLIMSDLKAPDYAHWILWNIPTSTQTLAEDVSAGTLPTSSQQAGAGGDVYTGPCPSAG